MPLVVPYAPQQIYQPNGRLVDLIRAQGADAARAAEMRGRDQALLWNGVGNAIQGGANAVLQATDPRRKVDAAQAQIVQGNATDAAQLRTGQRSLDSMMSGDQLPAGDTGPRQDSYLRPDGLYDIPKLNTALAQSGMGHLAPDLLKHAEDLNGAISTAQQHDQQAAQSKAIMLGYMASSALKLHTAVGMPLDGAMDFVAQPGLAAKQITPQDLAGFKAQIGKLPPDQQVAALQQIMDHAAEIAPKKEHGKDTTETDIFGRQTASNIVPEKPTEASLAADLSSPDPAVRDRARTALQALKPPPKQSIEEEWLARDRRLAVVKNGGKPLTDAQMKSVDSASMQDYAQSKADPAMRDAALAQKNVALLLAQAQLSQMPTKDQAVSVADDLVNHRISPDQLTSLFSTRGKEGLAFKLAVTSEAKKMDPSFNFEEAQGNYNLSKSTGFQNTVRYMDSALESIPQLEKNAANLGNGQFRTLNQLANAAKNQFNSTDLKRFKTDALLVGDEIAKILSGGGTGSATSDAKLKQATDIIGQSDSVPAIAAAMDEVKTLMGNRRRALTRGTYMEGSSAVKPESSATPIKVGGFTVVVK